MTDTLALDAIGQENAPPSVGQMLKTSRLARGLTIEEVSQNLCINKRQLSNLEEDEEQLVCDVYAIGFVKLYAQFLGLNTKDIVEKFRDQVLHHPKSPQLDFPAPLPGRGMPNFRILGGSLLVLTAIAIGWGWSSKNSPAPYPHPEIVLHTDEERPMAEPALSSLPLQEETAPVEDQPSDLASTPEPVQLHITEKAWIEVKDQEGNVIVNKLFQPGESHEFKDGSQLFLTTGNLNGTHLSSGEKSFPHVEKSGEIGRNIPLDPEKWVEHDPETH